MSNTTIIAGENSQATQVIETATKTMKKAKTILKSIVNPVKQDTNVTNQISVEAPPPEATN